MSPPRGLTVDDVRRALLSASRTLPSVRIGEDDSSLPRTDNVACLLHRSDDTWFVGYFERGRYDGSRVHPTESEACADFLSMLGVPAPDSEPRPEHATSLYPCPRPESGS